MALALLVAVLIIAPTRALAAPDAYESYWESTGPKWIEIDLSAQWLTAYQGSTPVFGAAVSTGAYPYYTPDGEFSIVWKQEWETMVGYDYYLPDVPYVMYFADYLAIHGTYWHDNFGYPMSHGCVNLPIWAAEWVYYWAPIGTGIWIHY
jgi:lipoprotein-anchoring transpeptidase ErfK/SrfK